MEKKISQKAKSLLKDPNLLERIRNDITTLGYVGEEKNKELAYLVGISRKMECPLAIVIKGASSMGKSELLHIITKLTPDDEVENLTRITKQVLLYKGKINPYILKHKLVTIEESAGSKDANFSIRILISEKHFELWTITGGMPETIKLYGPVAYISTTTDEKILHELSTRIFEIHLDDSKEQTFAIHEEQRKDAAEPWNSIKDEYIIEIHKSAQKLLQTNNIAVPYASKIQFPFDYPRARRDHQKFLDLIKTIAFLHQFQREKKTVNGVEYVLSSITDYELAYDLIFDVLKPCFDDLTYNGRRLLDYVQNIMESIPDGSFTRNDLVRTSGWSLRQVRYSIDELVEHEFIYVVTGRKGKEFVYKLNPNRVDGNAYFNELSKPEDIGKKTPDLLEIHSE